VTHQLCLYYRNEAGQIEIGCDGLSALQTALESFPSLSTDIPDYNLLGAIFHLRRRSKITWSYRHVKGHQDDQSSDLDLWAQRNIKMDQWAKDHIQTARHSSRHFNIPGEPWQLWAKDKKVTKHILPTLYETIFAYTSKEYWRSKANPEGIQEIDWPNIGRAMKAQPRSRRVFISKHVSGMCGVGKFMQCWKEWDSPNCPRCGLFEDAPYLWRCKGHGTKEIWNKAILDLESAMRQLDTDPTLAHVISSYLKSWSSDSGIQYSAPREFQMLILAQSGVGWRQFFKGWWVMHWASLQYRYYTIIKSTRTGNRWVSAIIQKLWNIAWDLWEHWNGILHKNENQVTRSMTLQLNSRVSQVYKDLSRAL
jgi:hypothetical protein